MPEYKFRSIVHPNRPIEQVEQEVRRAIGEKLAETLEPGKPVCVTVKVWREPPKRIAPRSDPQGSLWTVCGDVELQAVTVTETGETELDREKLALTWEIAQNHKTIARLERELGEALARVVQEGDEVG